MATSQPIVSIAQRKPYSVQQIFDLWNQRKSLIEIGKIVKLSPQGVGYVLSKIPEYQQSPGYAWPPSRCKHVVDLYCEGLGIIPISKIVAASRRGVTKVLRHYHVPIRGKAHYGEKNPSWNGGVTVCKGYRHILTPNHPHARNSGYVAEHRLVMEKHIGRYLTPGEVVHHINGDTMDNRIENLELFSSNAEHLAETLKGQCPNWTPEGKANMQAAADRKKESARLRKAKVVQQRLF